MRIFFRKKRFYLFIIVLSLNYPLQSQGFETTILLGINMSQLDGDNLVGFEKPGLHGGMRIEYPLGTAKGLALELLFQQKGSASSFTLGSANDIQSITLHTLSVPLLFYLNEWHQSEDFFRIRLEGGMVLSRLFDVSSTNSYFDNALDDFNDFDFGISGGLAYRFTQKTTLAFRIERSVLKIFEDPISQLQGLQSYLITFRFELKL